jgi:SAM-dependent methyltransferase
MRTDATAERESDRVVPPAADGDAEGSRRYWSGYGWPEGGDEWSKPWGGTHWLWACAIYPRLSSLVPASHILEIGCGHGRMSRYLRGYCERLTLVDVTPRCANHCERLFDGDAGVRVVLNDGRSLGEVDASSVDVVFSWDALVSVERSTLANYMTEIRRVLRPGCVSLLHHSNVGAELATCGHLDGSHLGGRRASQSAARARDDARAAGLRVLSQELLATTGAKNSTGQQVFTDCLTLLMRDEGAALGRGGAAELPVSKADWAGEVARARRLASMYIRPSEAGSA